MTDLSWAYTTAVFLSVYSLTLNLPWNRLKDMVDIDSPAGPSMATKFVADGPTGPVY